MADSVIDYDVVVLQEDIPQHGLLTGQYGTIMEIIRYDQFEVQFRDEHMNVVAKIPLNLSQIRVLRFEATLDDTAFWQLIEDAKAKSRGNARRELDLLVDTLVEQSIADIYIFGKLCKKYMWFAYRHEIWSAAIAIESGCSDDGFTDFLGWLVGQGEKVYYDALRDPETLLDLVEIKCDYGWAYGDVPIGIDFADDAAYEKKTGEEMRFGAGYPARPVLMGLLWDEETIRRKYPKLAAKFMIGECDEDSSSP